MVQFTTRREISFLFNNNSEDGCAPLLCSYNKRSQEFLLLNQRDGMCLFVDLAMSGNPGGGLVIVTSRAVFIRTPADTLSPHGFGERNLTPVW